MSLSLHEKQKQVLDFWFGDVDNNIKAIQKRNALWWGKDPKVDAYIAELFQADIEQARLGHYAEWVQTPEGSLALIILYDQFSRNIYRDTPQAFENDAEALRIALDMLARGEDRKLTPLQRVFAYLPLEHSENRDLQNQCVALFRDLMDDVSKDLLLHFKGFLEYAIAHQNIIERFGRFPHRNKILDRKSTPEEIEFLQGPNSGF